MKSRNIIIITSSITILFLFVLSLFSPYNVLSKMNEEKITNEPGIETLLKNEEIKDISYQGNNTYLISTQDKELVAVKDYYSIMNYKWYLYEKTDEWGGS